LPPATTQARARGPKVECVKKIKVLKDLGLRELSGAYLNGHYQQMERVGKENHSFCLMTNKRARFLGMCG
jgi:hypothetical protein